MFVRDIDIVTAIRIQPQIISMRIELQHSLVKNVKLSNYI